MPAQEDADGDQRELFLSFATSDRGWAEWVGWHLLQAGHRVRLYLWDVAAGNDFVEYMQQAAETAQQTVMLLSQAYLSSAMANTEWHAAFAGDPLGDDRRVIPLRIEPVDPPGLLKARVFADLFGVSAEDARTRLLAAISGPSGPPADEPPFPGTMPAEEEPRFPRIPELFNVPARNPHFTGRVDSLEQLRTGFTTDADVISVLHTEAIHGLGGVGKTQLAIEYSYRYAAEYDLVWWVPADDPTSAMLSLAQLGRRLGLPDDDDSERQISTLFEVLRRRDRWLLIFDNAESPGDIATLVPSTGPGHVLVTSRWSAWRTLGGSVRLGVLAREESIDLLASRSGRDAMVDVMDQIADELGDLPLALDEAAAYLEETGIDAMAYLALLRERAQELLLVPDADSTADQRRVATVWTVSLDRLRQQAPEAEGLLDLWAFFAPEDIPRNLLTDHPDMAGPFKALAADPLAFNEAVRAIGRFSMAQISDDSVSLHRLVQAVIQARLSEDDRKLMVWTASQLIVDAVPAEPTADARRLISHGLVVADHVLRSGLPSGIAALVLSEIGRIQRLSGQPRTALTTTRQAVDLIDDETPSQARWRCKMEHSRCLTDLGQFEEAGELQREVIEQTVRDSGTDSNEALIAKGDLAFTYWAQGKPQAAVELEQEVLEGRIRLDGPTHPLTLAATANLASSLRDIGDFREAIRLHEQALQGRLEAFGESAPATLSSMNNLAATLNDAGEIERAKELHARAFKAIVEHGDESDPQVLTAMSNQAAFLRDQGRLAEAEEMQRRVLETYEEIYGNRHPSTLDARGNVLLTRVDRGDKAALVDLEAVLEDMIAVNGEAHQMTLTTMNNLASLQAEAGAIDRASALLQRAVTVLTTTFGEHHPDTLTARANLASVTMKLDGEGESGREHLAELLETFRSSFGPHHESTLSMMNNIAVALAPTDFEKARLLLVDALGRGITIYEPGHRTMRELQTNLAATLVALREERAIKDALDRLADVDADPTSVGTLLYAIGMLVEAMDEQLSAFTWAEIARIVRSLDGAPLGLVTRVLATAGAVYWKARDLENALVLEREAFERAAGEWGYADPQTMTLLSSLNITLADAGLHEEALNRHREAYTHVEEEHGPGHPAAAQLAGLIGSALIRLERAEEAISVLTLALQALSDSPDAGLRELALRLRLATALGYAGDPVSAMRAMADVDEPSDLTAVAEEDPRAAADFLEMSTAVIDDGHLDDVDNARLRQIAYWVARSFGTAD